jgi:nuclear pore complex protein Nup188
MSGILAKDKTHYFSDPAAVIKVHESIKLLAPQGPHLLLAPAALSWALTMHRLFSALTEDEEELPPSHVQALVNRTFDQADLQTKLFETGEGVVEWYRFFAQLAFERGAFDVIAAISTSLFPTTGSKTVSCQKQIHEIFQSLLSPASTLLTADIFFSSFHMIPFNDSVVSAFQAIHNTSPELSHLFWQAAQSDAATPASDLLFAVRSRFPLSFLPLLHILTSSLHATTRDTIFNYFQALPTYTQTLQRGFTGYDIIEEERDNTLISLKSDLRVFSERDDGEGAVIVQTGTVGRLLSRGESIPTVMWEWPFNGWALLGRVLETVLANGVTQVIAADESYMPILTSIFAFLSRAMEGGGVDGVAGIVQATSEEMAQEWDVISVTWEMVAQVLEVLDIGTITHVDLVNLLRLAEAGMGVLTAAVHGREASIWSLIVKGGIKWWGRLARVGIAAEMTCQEVCMPLTMSGVSFVDALFSAAVRNIVLSDGFSAHLRKEVLSIAGNYATDVWLNFNEWKYTVPNRRFEIGTKLCRMFNRIVSEVYTIDAAHGPENRITGVLAPTADRILEMFLSLDEDITRPFEALFYACYVSKEILVNIEEGVDQGWVTQAEDWAKEALYLANTVVRTRPIVKYPHPFPEPNANDSPDFLKFEVHIFSQLKILNILLTTSPALRIPTFTLLRTLLSVPQPRILPGEHEQASILAHLRGDEKFHIPLVIDIVTDPLMDPEIRASVWRYASSVMGSYQQGLAILLLFGEETGRKTANKPAVVEDKEEKETFLRKAITMVVEDDLHFRHLVERQVFGTNPKGVRY